MAALLKIALVPLVVWAASVAGRRWGHAVTGWISGLPLIAGPISVFLALDEGPRFAADTAAMTLQATGASGAHCLVFAHAGRRWRWPLALLAAWAAFVASAAVLGAIPVPPLAGLALAVGALWLALAAMPRAPRAAGPVAIPNVELAVRVAAATALAAAVMLGASALGPQRSGLLLTFPITGSVLPAFTLALYGAAATARLLTGFLLGLFAFAVFHATVALALPALGVALAYPAAVAAALATTGLLMRLRR